ncbi:MAG: epoxyqueuosine reductase [Clostridia bacterium]|nr:epoxyqueuosine reductase [Clostridia bacterium]
MKDTLRNYFSSQNIEYYAVLPYSACREINPGIMQREDFTPKSVIVYLLPYYTGETVNLSRYAASLDYHIALRECADGLISALRTVSPDIRAKGYGDHSPISEVSAALIAGLGAIGDNGLILNEKYGSYVFIGDVVTDIPPELLGAIEPREVMTCHHCGACKRACPTGILRAEGQDCLSAITQRKGDLTEEEKGIMREYNTAWGCDLCQSVCPYNRDPAITPIDFFHRERISELTRDLLDSMDKSSFMRRAFAWRGRKTVERNLDILSDK